MANAPLVSVVMPVYRSDAYLKEAIESILNQTFEDLEFLIIVDEPTAETRLIIDEYAQKDDRISVHYQNIRLGLIESLNHGCEIAKGKYIARMDSDDISLPNRLEKQIRYLEKNPNVSVIGSWMEYIDDNGNVTSKVELPSDPPIVRWNLLYYDCIPHPSMVACRDVIKRLDYYSKKALHVEDYDLLARASIITDIANIPEVLLRYRIHDSSISVTYYSQQEESAARVSKDLIYKNFEYDVPLETIKCFRRMFFGLPLSNRASVKNVDELINTLYKCFIRSKPITSRDIRNIRKERGNLYFKFAISSYKAAPYIGFKNIFKAFVLNPKLSLSRIINILNHRNNGM